MESNAKGKKRQDEGSQILEGSEDKAERFREQGASNILKLKLDERLPFGPSFAIQSPTLEITLYLSIEGKEQEIYSALIIIASFSEVAFSGF